MSTARRCSTFALVAACTTLLNASCKREAPAPPAPPAPAPPASEPLDRLLPGELPEGREEALGLKLPRELHVLRTFGSSVVARGRVDSGALTQFVRARVSASAVETSADRTTFPRVHVNGAAPHKVVKIEVVRDGEASMLLLEDVTAPPTTPGLSDDERWRRAGVNPRSPLDPGQL